MDYTIRDLQHYDEMLTVHRLQQEIWGFESNMGIYPPLMVTAAKNGGVVLGAFIQKTDQMIGFLFSFLGRAADGSVKLCSQAMGVRADWRGRGVAESLKRNQRDRALAQGLALITWTVDPLEGPNAYLNLHKLRAIARTYWRDLYGQSFGDLNAGLPSDRLEIEWWLDDERPPPPERTTPPAPAIFRTEGKGVARRVTRLDTGLVADRLALEIPASIQAVKETDMELARDWRLEVRRAMEHYFAAGYIAVDLVSTVEDDERRNYYILQKLTPALKRAIGMA